MTLLDHLEELLDVLAHLVEVHNNNDGSHFSRRSGLEGGLADQAFEDLLGHDVGLACLLEQALEVVDDVVALY